MNADYAALNRTLKDLASVIKEHNKRAREINETLRLVVSHCFEKEKVEDGKQEVIICRDLEGNEHRLYAKSFEPDMLNFKFTISRSDSKAMCQVVSYAQRYLNDLLRHRGFVTLNEACAQFCIKQDPGRCNIGWLFNCGKTKIEIDLEPVGKDEDQEYIIIFKNAVNILDGLYWSALNNQGDVL